MDVRVHPLRVEITKVWVEDWTTLADLSGTNRLFGDIRVIIGGRDLPGFSAPFEELGYSASKAGQADVGASLEVLMGLKRIGARSRKKPVHKYRKTIHGLWFRVTLNENRLSFVPLYGNGHPVGEYADLWMDYDQVKAELADLKARFTQLLLKDVPKEEAEDWYWLKARERLFED